MINSRTLYTFSTVGLNIYVQVVNLNFQTLATLPTHNYFHSLSYTLTCLTY